ncbi:MAG: hypothetical protein C5B47_05765 [Verrucomicrobia bacterium]|nr:MAG: hypothetical protein C5B47_05765 [Verrucomicrobiota bacterium]
MLPVTNRTRGGFAYIANVINVSLLLTASGIAAHAAPPPDTAPQLEKTAISSAPANNKYDGHIPPPGLGDGESVVFPANSRWPIIYRDRNGELGLTLPMSEGIWGTGDWFGLRHSLEDSGVDITGGYTNNMLGNVVGGKKQGFTYADQIWLRADFNMEKLIGWKGAHLGVSVIDRNGQKMASLYTGNFFNPNQIWGSESFELYNIYLDQSLFNGWVDIKLGRMAVTDDFAHSALYGLLVNNGIDGQPNAICSSGYMTAWPASTWGGRIRIDDKKDHLYGMFGLYQITSRQYNPNYHGVDFGIRPYDGLGMIAEVGWTPEFQPHPRPVDTPKVSDVPPSDGDDGWHGMAGHYKFGAYYVYWPDIPTFNGQKAPGTYGFYWTFDQMVYQAKPGSDCGLTLWGACILAPDQRTAVLPFSFYGGAIYTGLIPGRSKDKTTVGVIYGAFSDVYAHSEKVPTLPEGDRGVPTYELVLEACYTIQLSKFWNVQPDVQYIINPGGTGRIPNALVIGAQVNFSF